MSAWTYFPLAARSYLVCVDHWSGYPLYQLLRSLTSDAVLQVLSFWFNMSSIHSDGGPQFRGDFIQFYEKHGIQHELSAPYNPKSNGFAKAGVKSVKNILRK